MAHDLKSAFQSAVYRVYAPHGPLDLRVDDADAAQRLRENLPARGRTDAWVITPCNPGGHRVATWINRRRLRELERTLRDQDIPWWPAVNLDPAGDWPDEPGVCAWSLDEHAARELGRRFGQAALLRLPPRGAPRLLWLENAG